MPVSDRQALELRRLVTRPEGKFVPNVACVLLFARDPLVQFPGCQIHVFRYEGEAEGTGEHWNAVKDIVIEGPIPVLIQQAESMLSPHRESIDHAEGSGKR